MALQIGLNDVWRQEKERIYNHGANRCVVIELKVKLYMAAKVDFGLHNAIQSC